VGAFLLATKNYMPLPQVQWIDRQRLISRLNAALDNHHRLTLVSASAGAGKSSLLAEWAATAADRPAVMVWVSLDVQDNDPVRLWTYCLAAVQTHFPDQVKPLLEALSSPQPPDMLVFLNETVNLLASLPVEKLVLILDDYHVIDTQAVHDSLGYFIDHIPPNIHLVIATRSDPPLPLHRWRGRGQMTEIRFDDLRFTLPEIQLFLNERMRLGLNAENIQQLERRTEGWIVGLHLAALLMQNRPDRAAFIAQFSSNNHYILEYLTNEVLAVQSENDQDFLLQISILTQFTPELCNAVTGRSDSQMMLERFWKANLFLIPLDDEHLWYRYHHLFADLLSQKLKQKGDTNLAALHQKAADWYAAHLMVEEAIRFALAARNYSMAADLVFRNRRSAMNTGDFKRFFTWMEQIPAELLAADARLSFAYGAMLYNNGKTALAEKYLTNAHEVYKRLTERGEIPPADPEYATLPGQIAAFQSMLALRRWNLIEAAQYAEESLRIALADDLHSQGMAGLALGIAQTEMGRLDEAIKTYNRAIPPSEACGNVIAAAVASEQMARLLVLQGRLTEAEETFETALERAIQRRQEELPAAGVLLVGQAEVCYERNQLERASEGLEKGLTLVHKGGYLDIQKTAAILKTKIFTASGNLPEAIDSLKNTQDVIRKAGIGLALTEINAYLALYYALGGKLDQATTWADNQDTQLAGNPGLTRGIELFCLARIWFRQGKLEDAWNVLAQLEKYAQEGKSLRRQVEAWLLQALIAGQQNRRAECFELLDKSIRWGMKPGYLRLFLDEGEALRQLLLDFLKNERHEKWIDGLAQEILAGFPRAVEGEEIPLSFELIRPAPPARLSPHGLVEKISDRELEVLALMSEGLTNPEIAGRLILSLSTVKTHLNNIYGKLNVRNRAEAVLRAKELGLL
jgi:LuxR family transcriptional regulator, maltose regulon positive regulatory protein